MPGIFGVIDFKRKENISINKSIIEKSYEIYDIDEFRHLNNKNIHMSYACQYITNELKNELLPYEDSSVSLVCDAMIHNKSMLYKKLNVNCDEIDSRFIVEAYKKWGQEAPKELVGEFSYCIFDSKKNNAILCRDHTGKSILYYYYKDGLLVFSTIINTIVQVLKEFNINLEKNEKYLANVVGLNGMLNEYEVSETPYNDIFILPPATYMVFNDNRFESKKYWDPLKIKIKYGISDEECNKEFLDIFKEAIKCRLKSSSNTAIKISGGLDSTSVAALACMELKKEDKKLYGFNFSPLHDFNGEVSEYYINNEMEYVNELAKMYPNLNVECLTCEGENSITSAKELVKVLEMPYKIVENLYWGVAILKEARKNDARIILSGQFGNSTISFGDFYGLSNAMLKKNPLLFYRELKGFCNRGRYYKRRILKRYIKGNCIKQLDNKNVFEKSIISKQMIDRYNLNEIYLKKAINVKKGQSFNIKKIRECTFDSVAFSHLGIIESKIALYTGVYTSDPTKDKRLIEFCLSLPPEQYIRDGEDRYLIRRAMKGILPDFIRCNYLKRGLQSADWIYRLYLDTNFVNSEILQMLNNEECKKFIDFSNVFKNKDYKLEDTKEKLNVEEMRKIIRSLIFHYYISNDESL